MFRYLALTCVLLGLSPAALATWSIAMADTETGEVAIGSATCLTGFDLQRLSPVVRVGTGVAAAQSLIDQGGANRMLIWDLMGQGVGPQAILRELRLREGRGQHNTRQYGIADVRGRTATFSGSSNGAFAGGRVGQAGSIVYSVQGNVITGMAVVDAAADAIENTPGDMAEKLMAAMEAAYCMGGDGRCSCDEPQADDCGAPPGDFSCEIEDLTQNPKTADIGYIIVARRGDDEGVCNGADGCANGNYYLNKNVRNTQSSDPDPVFTLRARFDNWRNFRRGEPDQVRSTVEVAPNRALPGAARVVTVRIELEDWEGLPPTGIENVEVLHDPEGGVASSSIGDVQLVDADQHIYEVEVISGDDLGLDQLAVRVTYDGGIQRYLMPGGRLAIQDPRGDFNADGIVGPSDMAILLANFGAVGGDGDFDGNGVTNLTDLAQLLSVPGLGWPE